MTSRNARGRELSDEDRILWNRVARSAMPLRGRALLADSRPAEGSDEVIGNVMPPASPPRPAGKAEMKTHAHLDRATRQKLGKGRLPIEGRVDLHGMTQAHAHGLLHGFLLRAHTDGVRHVLVITGKGASFGSDGVLRRAVPQWLATPLFKPLVSGFDAASRGHGGDGALYVRLRRR